MLHLSRYEVDLEDATVVLASVQLPESENTVSRRATGLVCHGRTVHQNRERHRTQTFPTLTAALASLLTHTLPLPLSPALPVD
ncbi:Hypothetical predicted protein [Xyrichtys novacula]|uniref:Uncharacterized protein n=1 Tax=Xyrichtys novacula TaxID=13765 RepID=A0AAV1H0W7_XYRNO|nr:Hypothetical predicted protein [Xyrichtys novacula]